MGNYQYFLEVILDRNNGFFQLFQAIAVLGAKSLVDNQGRQGRTGTPGKQFRKSDTYSKIYTERFSAAEHLVIAGAKFIGYLYVKCFHGIAFLGLSLRFYLHTHPVIRHSSEEFIRLDFDFR